MIGTTVEVTTHFFPDLSYYMTMICDTCGWEAESKDEKEVIDISRHHLVYSHGVGNIKHKGEIIYVSPRPQ